MLFTTRFDRAGNALLCVVREMNMLILLYLLPLHSDSQKHLLKLVTETSAKIAYHKVQTQTDALTP